MAVWGRRGRQVDPELGAERAHDLVQQQDDGRLHGALERPVVLQTDMGGVRGKGVGGGVWGRRGRQVDPELGAERNPRSGPDEGKPQS